VVGSGVVDDPVGRSRTRAGLRPGGRLVFSTLAHYRTNPLPESEARQADHSGRTGASIQVIMHRWVLATVGRCPNGEELSRLVDVEWFAAGRRMGLSLQ
jgi:hypothetical protein